MRHLALLALVVACGNSPATRDAGGGDDGGGPGDDGMTDPDGMIDPDAPDGMIDPDAMLDAPANQRGQVTVRVVDSSGNGIVGLHAVYIDTDTTITHVQTDANGDTTANVLPGASVTAVRARTTGGAYSLTTVQALVPGDTVTLVSAPGSVSSVEDPFTQRTIPLPAAAVVTATTSGTTGTFTTLTPHGLAVGNTAIVAGVGGGYDGSRTVATVPTPTSFTATVTSGAPNSSTGTVAKGERFDVDFPNMGGTSTYEVRHPCGVTTSSSSAATLILRAGCSAPTMNLVVLAKNSGGTVIGYTQKNGVTFTPGGSTVIADGFVAPAQVTTTYSNLTAQVNTIELERHTPYVRGLAETSINECLNETAGADPTCVDAAPLVLSSTVSKPTTALARSRFSCPTGTGSGCISNGMGVAQQLLTRTVDGTAASLTVDVGANLLPWVSAIYDPATTTIDLTVTGTAAYDIFEADLRYVRDPLGTPVIYTWRVFGPVAQDVTFPTLPNTVPGDPTVRSTDTQSSYGVWLGESDVINGYRDAIQNVYESLGTCETAATPGVRRYGGTTNRVSRWN